MTGIALLGSPPTLLTDIGIVYWADVISNCPNTSRTKRRVTNVGLIGGAAVTAAMRRE
jgi:hypothetical protein